MWTVGKKYNCVWADWVLILHAKTNGDYVAIDSREEVHIIHPERFVFDEDGNQILLKEMLVELHNG